MIIKFQLILTRFIGIIVTIPASCLGVIIANVNSPAEAQKQPQGTATTSSLPEYCSPDEYKTFFENFVRGQDFQGNETRLTYTADLIEVRDYENPSYLIGTLSKKDDEFSIDLRDYRWVQLVPSTIDNSPYTRLNIDLIRINNNTFRVNYIKAHYAYDPKGEGEEYLDYTYGEPGAYIFEHRNGCWNLTQKLQ